MPPRNTYRVEIDRELSPESTKIVLAQPGQAPSGTRTRPAKMSKVSNSTPTAKSFTHSMSRKTMDDVYIEHIKSLNPNEDEAPIKEFDIEWANIHLSNFNSVWPERADDRIRRYLHNKESYSINCVDLKDLKKSLVKGSGLQTRTSRVDGILEQKLKDRVKFLIQLLEEQDIITRDGRGALQMNKSFRSWWENRHRYWRTDSDPGAPSRKRAERDAYEVLPSEEEDTVAFGSNGMRRFSVATTMPLPKQISVPSLYQTGRVAPPRMEERRLSHPNKRQKINSDKAAPLTVPVEDLIMDEWHNGETARQAQHARDFLTSASSVQRLSRPPSIDELSPLFTQESDRQGRSRNPSPDRTSSPPWSPKTDATEQTLPHQPQSVRTTPISPPVSPNIGNLALPGADKTPDLPQLQTAGSINTAMNLQLHTPVKSPASKPEISLILQNSLGEYDLVNPVPASQLKISSIGTFFELASERSGVPLDNLDCLTFTFSFIGKTVEVFHKDESEAMWDSFKDKIRRLYRFTRMKKPSHTEFEIWVEIGDARRAGMEEEDLGGL